MADTTCRGYLISIKDNGESGSRLPIAVDSCYIGANAECEVRLVKADLNDRHCLIKFLHNKQATIYSLCENRPVLLNDKPVNENGSSLKNGDIIQIIDVKFIWEENDAFDLGRHSMNTENNALEAFEHKRFSEPTPFINRKNLIEDKQEDESHPNCNNINVDEKKDETKVTSETTPLTKSSISSSSFKTAISSCGNNRSHYNRDSQNRSENNSSQDGSQIRRSRQFCQTFKTKSTANTSDKKKTTSTAKLFFQNSPLQENNRSHGREVKSRCRFFESRNSSIKLATPLSFVETSEKISVRENENGNSNHVVNVDSLDKELENIVPIDDELKENTLGNEFNADEATFETTVPSDMADGPSVMATPKCFNNAIHSTPKAPNLSKSELASEANETTNISDAVYGPNDPTQVYNLDNNSILASPVKSFPESDAFCKKKVESDHSRMEADSLSETCRRHTRSTSNMLKRTFEECSEDNGPVSEKSLTTPEKSTNECSSHSGKPAFNVEESELDSYSPEKKVDSRKSVSGSIRSPMLESTSELSAENGDAVASLSSELRDKSQKYDESSMMAKCSRNLSSFSPPENNKSQEYMDSVVSTPKKQCLMDNEEVSLSVTAVTTPAKDSAVDDAACMSTPKTPSSPTRYRRSTGIVPCVGTPSDVYRTIKGGLTPAHKSRFNRTSMEVEVSMGPRDSLSSIAPSKLAPKRSSSERKSTPIKSEKSLVRDSLQMHSPILEEYALENEESQSESPNNDSQFKFVSKRRRRLAKSSFAIEDRILEESEIISSDLSNREDEVVDEEESLEPLESFDDNSEFTSARIVVNQTTGNDTENGLDSTYTLDSLEEAVSESKLELTRRPIKPIIPKSILTPLPRHAAAAHEKSAKKVTFFNVKEDSFDSDASACTMTDMDIEFDLQLSSRVNSSAEMSGAGRENNSLPKSDSEDERLYLPDKSSDTFSSNDCSVDNSGSLVQRIVAKHHKLVKRLSSGSKSKSPRLSGIRRLMNPPKSPKCNYLDVSGVKQLMKTPESLVKPVRKPSSLGKRVKTPETVKVKSPEPSKEIQKTPESGAKSYKTIASRQKTPASFGKRVQTPEALAECLSVPKALMKLVNPPEIVVEFVETPKKADVSVTLPKNEVCEITPEGRRNSHAGSGDSTFTTPTVRRCSKHFRIHRNSVCHSLASSLNATLNQTLSPQDCSASLENSVVEQNEGNADNEVMPPPQNPEVVFKAVLVELKEKLQTLQKRQHHVDKEVLENSINMIDEALIDEVVPDSDTGVVEEKLENALLELKKRISLEKSDANNESIVRVESRQSVVLAAGNEELCTSSQSSGKDDMVVTVAGEAGESSSSDESIADAVSMVVDDLTKSVELSSIAAESVECETVVNDYSDVKKLEEIQSSAYDSAEEIIVNVFDGSETEEVDENISSVAAVEEVPSITSVALHSEKISSISCADSVEIVLNATHLVEYENTQTGMSNVTSSIEVDSNSLCTTSEDVLSITDNLSKSVDAYHSAVEFEIKSFTLVEKESTLAADEELPVTGSISEPVESELLQNNYFTTQICEEEEQLRFDASLSDVAVRTLPKHVAEVEHESDSQGLELFVSDSDEVAPVVAVESESIAEEKSTSNETVSDVTKTTFVEVEETVEIVGDSLSVTKSSLPEKCVEETELRKSVIPSGDYSTAEKVIEKSSVINDSAVLNDTSKFHSPISNLTLTIADAEEVENKSKILDSIIAHDKSKKFFDVSASLLVHEENKENLLSLTPIAVSAKEKSVLDSSVEETEKTPPPSASDTLLLTLVTDTPHTTNSLESSLSAENDINENVDTSDKNVVTPTKASSAETETKISLTSPYLSDVELDTTCEENLSCIEPSMAEMETASHAETSVNVTEESSTTVTSCEADVKKSASSETLNSSQASTVSYEMPTSSEASSAAQPYEVSSSVSNGAEMTPVIPGPPDSNAELMVTPPRCPAVCVSIESQDQLTLAGPKVVAQKLKDPVKSISTSTPIFFNVTQKTMEIPPSCCTTIDTNVSPSEDESAGFSSESSEIDGEEHTTVDSSADLDESPSKCKTIHAMVPIELASDAFAESQPAETVCEETCDTDDVVGESQSEFTSVSVSQEIASATVSKASVLENGIDVDSKETTDEDDEVEAPVDSTEKVEIPVKRPSRNLSVVIEDAKADIPVVKLSSKPNSTPQEAVGKSKTVAKSVTHENADNEGESVRPKRGRPTKRYTEFKSESSTQSSKRTKNSANEGVPNVMNVSVELERFNAPEEEEPVKATARKTVHFNIEPKVKRSTRPRDLGKLYVPTPNRRRTVSKSEDLDESPSTSDRVEQLGSPCSIIIRKMGSGDSNASVTTKAPPKRALRSRSVALNESVLSRSSRAANSIEDSPVREAPQPKRGSRAKKSEQVSSSHVSTEKESQPNDVPTLEVAQKSKKTSKASKSAAKNSKKTEVAEPPKEVKRSKRKVANDVVQNEENAEAAGCSTSGSKGRSKDEVQTEENADAAGSITSGSKGRSEVQYGEEADAASSSTSGSKGRRKNKVQNEEKADVAGSSKSGSEGRSKNESSETFDVAAGGERKTRRKAAEVVETKAKKKTTKSRKNASQSNDEEPINNAESQNEVPAEEGKRSRRKVAEDVQQDEKNDVPKASKRATKGAEKKVAETSDDSNRSVRATRQRTAAQPVVETADAPKSTKRAKVDSSAETASTSRATRSRKDAAESSKSSEMNAKSTESETAVAPKTSKSRATKRTASVVLESIDEVVNKKRRPLPDPAPVATRTTRNKKTEVVVATNELSINLKRQTVNEKDDKPSVSTKKAKDDEKPVASTNKKKRDPTPSENVKSTRVARAKEAPQKEVSVETTAASTSRVTRSQSATRSRNAIILPASLRAKK